MAVADLTDWMNDFGKPGHVWYAKRLASNDTLATKAHQAGPYIPKEFLFRMFPVINQPTVKNPDTHFDLYIDSHSDHSNVRAVWYNGKLRKDGTRNETRLTSFGGRKSAMLDPESTGALTLFAFVTREDGSASNCHVWICRNLVEEDLAEDRLGPVEPKAHLIWEPGKTPQGDLFEEIETPRANCRLVAAEIPAAWLAKFPSGEDIIRKTYELRPLAGTDVDARLIKRRACEFEIFRSVEEAVFLPKIKKGFTNIDGFLGLAQSILQSRKSRSGTSLELHIREIMSEEGLKSGADFTHRPVIEGGKRPDFLFPSQAAYDNAAFPAERLRMLAAKTTCKDRWRQVINEADRIGTKHLLTLQEGVSEGQFREMSEAGIALVVPQELHKSYPKGIRHHLISFESFLGDVRLLNFPK